MTEQKKQIRNLMRRLRARATRPEKPTAVLLRGGPWGGNIIQMTTPDTLNVRVGIWHGRYTRMNVDVQNRRIFGSWFHRDDIANWVPAR